MLSQIIKIASTAKNACGIDNLLLAESSNVLSNHCVAKTNAPVCELEITYFASDEILSLLIGFLLYAIALDPI